MQSQEFLAHTGSSSVEKFETVAVEMDHQPPNFVCSQVHKTRSVLETTQVKLAIR